MIRRRTVAVLTGVLVLLWLGLAYCSGPPDAHEYQRTAVNAAQATLSAVRTVALAGAERDRLLAPAFDVVVDDSAGAVASAQQQLTAQQPPGGWSAGTFAASRGPRYTSGPPKIRHDFRHGRTRPRARAPRP
jgi:hypothetical protein